MIAGLRRIPLRATRHLVPLAAILLLVRTIDLGSAFRLLAAVDPLRLAAVLALFGIGPVLSCLRWRLALGQIVPSPPGIATLLRSYLIGMFVNLGVPTTVGGDVVRAELIRRQLGARGNAYASILADRLIGLLAVVLLAVVATLFAGVLFVTNVRHFVAAAALILALSLAALAPAFIRLNRRARSDRFGHFLDALLLLARSPRILALSLTIAVVVQSLAVVVPIALLAVALKIDVPLAMHFVLVPVIVLLTQVPLAPGGLGVRETACVLLYGHIAVPPEAAFSLGLGWSLVLVAFGLCGGVALLVGQNEARSKGGSMAG